MNSTWSKLGTSSGPFIWRERAPLPQPRAGYMAGVLSDKLIVAGGSYWEGKRKAWTARVSVFDPRANRWDVSTPMPEPRSDAASVAGADALYVFGGGSNSTAGTDALTFREGKWKRNPGARLPEPRLYAVAVESRRSIYLIGGLAKGGDYSTASNDLWKLNLADARKRWRKLPPLPGPGRISHAVAGFSGRIYVFGGAAWDGAKGVRNLNDAYEFNPQDSTWKRLPDLPVGRRCWWAVGLERQILLLGGYSEHYEKEILIYNPRSKSLRHEGALPYAVCDAKFFRIGNDLVGAGGEIGTGVRGRSTIETQLPRSLR